MLWKEGSISIDFILPPSSVNTRFHDNRSLFHTWTGKVKTELPKRRCPELIPN